MFRNFGVISILRNLSDALDGFFGYILPAQNGDPSKIYGNVYVINGEHYPGFFSDSDSNLFFVESPTRAVDSRNRGYNVITLDSFQYKHWLLPVLTPKKTVEVARQYLTANPGIKEGILQLLGSCETPKGKIFTRRAEQTAIYREADPMDNQKISRQNLDPRLAEEL